MIKEDIDFYKDISREIIQNVEEGIFKHVGKKESGKIIKMGADGTPTKMIDLIAETRVIDVLKKVNKPLFLISEEVGELKIHGNDIEEVIIKDVIDEKLRKYPIFIVDPLDGTTNAVKGLSIYGISIAVAEFPEGKEPPSLEDIVYGIVKNFSDEDLFEAVRGGGSYFNGIPAKNSEETYLSNVTLGGFIYGNRIAPISNLLRSVRRLRLLGSVAVELSYIANGTYDTFIDLRKSKVIDISAAKLIIEESGGIITNFEGRKLKNELSVIGKTAIIASNNEKIHEEIMEIYQSDRTGNKNIKKIGITTRLDKKEALNMSEEIIEYLERCDIEVYVDESLANKTGKYSDKAISLEKMHCDIIIALGGDGTILRTQKYINNKRIPILGVNLGTVGFLTEIEPKNVFNALEEVVAGNYTIEKRSRLSVYHNNELPLALNEVVLMTRRTAKMLNMEIYVDDNLAEEVRADGLIVSTPSGSTAYSMSAGGPIVDPKVNSFIIIPICPYKLGARALVVSDESEIKVKLVKKGKDAIAIIDGQYTEEINYPEEIIFKKAKQYTYLVNLGQNFYEKVKNKLTEGGIK